MIAAVVIGGMFLAGMAAAAGYAVWALPAGARVPLNPGVPELSLWLPKPAGLAAWLGAGVVTFAAFAWLTLSGLSADWATSVRVVLLPGVETIPLESLRKLAQFAQRGGHLVATRRLPARAPGFRATDSEQREGAGFGDRLRVRREQ